jgi:hypothetical protein
MIKGGEVGSEKGLSRGDRTLLWQRPDSTAVSGQWRVVKACPRSLDRTLKEKVTEHAGGAFGGG